MQYSTPPCPHAVLNSKTGEQMLLHVLCQMLAGCGRSLTTGPVCGRSPLQETTAELLRCICTVLSQNPWSKRCHSEPALPGRAGSPAPGVELLILQLLGAVRFAFPGANVQENRGQILLGHRNPASPALAAQKPGAPAMFFTLPGEGLAFRLLPAEIPKTPFFKAFLCGARSTSGVVLPSGCVNRFSKPAHGENAFPAATF